MNIYDILIIELFRFVATLSGNSGSVIRPVYTDARSRPLRKRLSVSFIFVVCTCSQKLFPSTIPLPVLIVLTISAQRKKKWRFNLFSDFIVFLCGIYFWRLANLPFILIDVSGYGVVVFVIPNIRLAFRIRSAHFTHSTVAGISVSETRVIVI